MERNSLQTLMIEPAASESVLVERARRGDEQAFNDLVRGLLPKLIRTARKVVRNETDAEDVVQNAIIQGIKHLGDFRQEAQFSTWMNRITFNEAIVWLRKHSRETASLDDSEYSEARPAFVEASQQGRTPEQVFASKEFRTLLRDALNELPEKARKPLLLKAVEGLTGPEIADRLNVPLNTVKIRIHRARKELRDRISARLGPLAAADSIGGAMFGDALLAADNG